MALEEANEPALKPTTSCFTALSKMAFHCALQCVDSLKDVDMWILDIGATNRMVCDDSLFTSEGRNCNCKVNFLHGSVTHAFHCGDVKLTYKITLHNALYVPSFTFNLTSIRKLTYDLKCCIVF